LLPVLVVLLSAATAAPALASGRPGSLEPANRPKKLAAPVQCPRCWHPALNTSWQWQLSGTLDTSLDVQMYDVDLFDTSAAQVDAINGGTDRFAQATILNLYDPDRSQLFLINGKTATSEGAVDFLSQLSRTTQGTGGKGLSFLLERSSSPSRLRLQKLVSEKFPQAKWYIHDAVDLDIDRRAAPPAGPRPFSLGQHAHGRTAAGLTSSMGTAFVSMEF